MHFSLATIIAVVPLLASASPLAKQPHSKIPLARKSNLHQEDGSLDADKLKGHLASTVDKYKRDLETYERNTGKRHPLQPDVVSAGTKRDVFSEEMIEGYKQYWMAGIQVGTPPQDFWVEIDTSTSDLYIPLESCKDGCDHKALYKSGASSTSKALGKTFGIERYGSSASVDLYTDTVTVAHNYAIANQTFGAATSYGKGFSDANWGGPDGLLGLGYPIISLYDEPTVFENLVANGKASKAVFALKLNGHDNELTLGGLNPDAFTGTPIYTPVTQEGLWQIKFDSFKVGDTAVVGHTHALVNSGARYVAGSKAAVQAIYAKIEGSKEVKENPGFFTFPCATRLPPISFTLGANELFLEPETLNLGPTKVGSDTCTGSIVYEETFETGLWIFGDSLLANFYTIFDFENNQIGFAKPTA